MKTALMRYKGFEWEHNPSSLSIDSEKAVSSRKYSFDDAVTSELGKLPRTIKGKGWLTGEGCIETYARLLELKNRRGSGILSLPGCEPFYAYFTGLELVCSDAPERVGYSFVFTEDLRPREKQAKKYHTVENGETLWDVSWKYDVRMEKLVELNPEIRRADELEEGDKVRIC